MKIEPRSVRVLVVDDDDQDRSYMAARIASWGYETRTASNGVEALGEIPDFAPDVIVSDLRMPVMDGFELTKKLKEKLPAPPVIMLTQFGDIRTALLAVKDSGVFWFIEKPVPPEVLQVLIERAGTQHKLFEENDRLREALRSEGVGPMVGQSPQMHEIFSLIRRVGPSKATVLITGESGTGKELVARGIHSFGPRNNAVFIALNCAALPETLIESELFGYEKGAFTGAFERRAGKIELAHGGTLFLDEIAEMAPAMQAKLLRVLEDSRVRRIGGKSEIEVDVRILAATNRPPLKAVREGKLREDLYYRLGVFNIAVPPLRERKEDIPLLVDSLLLFMQQKHNLSVKGVHPEVVDRLVRYSWPGNVRELRNVLERAMILAGDGEILPLHLPENLGVERRVSENAEPQPDRIVLPLGTSLSEAERALILATLEFTNKNRGRTADILGLSLKTIQTKLKQYQNTEAEEGLAQQAVAAQ
jgi:DNA-binding NtrC family response regulator